MIIFPVVALRLAEGPLFYEYAKWLHWWKVGSHFHCFAHVINLGVQKALTCLEESISKVKFVV